MGVSLQSDSGALSNPDSDVTFESHRSISPSAIPISKMNATTTNRGRTRDRLPDWLTPPPPPVHEMKAGSKLWSSNNPKDETLPLDSRNLVTVFQPASPLSNQSTCSLIKMLSPELRRMIWELALISYEDKTKPRIDKESDTYRPGHFCHRRTDTSLIRTCQLIYYETHLTPAACNIHTIFYRRFCTAIYRSMPTKIGIHFRPFTSAQLAAVRHVHVYVDAAQLRARQSGTYSIYSFFAEWAYLRTSPRNKVQRYGLYGPLDTPKPQLAGPHPKTLTITVRHTGWKSEIEDGNYNELLTNICGNQYWGNIFWGLRELKMELEVGYHNKEELRPVLEQLRGFIWDIGSGERLVADGQIKERTWVYPEDLQLSEDSVEQQDRDDGYREETEFWVGSIVWKVQALGQNMIN